MSATPCSTQWLLCSDVDKSASNTSPTCIAFRRCDVTYTGHRYVFCTTMQHENNYSEVSDMV